MRPFFGQNNIYRESQDVATGGDTKHIFPLLCSLGKTFKWLALITWCMYPTVSIGTNFEIRSVSSRWDAVSGTDALVLITPPPEGHWSVENNGKNITQEFHATSRYPGLLALVTDLRLGKNIVRLRIDGVERRKAVLIAHPKDGPIFSGPHQHPFVCQTQENGLGPPLDAACNAATVVQYFYMPAERPSGSAVSPETDPGSKNPMPGFLKYDEAGPVPTNVARTTTTDGQAVDFIVRREIGTINRSVYEIEFLHRPGTPLPSAWMGSTAGWNGRLVYVFGGGCRAGYRQGNLGQLVSERYALLEKGYALATSTLNVFGNDCNDRVSAETLSMVKEHFIKQYGEPVHTIGLGASGGAMQLYLIVQNYPGLLDGIVPFLSYPDRITTLQSFGDCALLNHAFAESSMKWTEYQKSTISGFATWETCARWEAPIFDPRNCSDLLPKQWIYDRRSNPKGIRCDIYTNEVNVLGRNSDTGMANHLFDNVGVQYGLRAFNEGKIDAAHFIELNERIGGYDDDGSFSAARSAATASAVTLAYERGLVLTGSGGLRDVPIIDWRWYGDDLGDDHDSFRSLETRARLVKENGAALNQIILIYPRADTGRVFQDVDPATSTLTTRERSLVREMDLWLDNIARDNSRDALWSKVVRSKPPELVDGCWTAGDERLYESVTETSEGPCHRIYPAYADPRMVAGSSVADDVLKCTLRPFTPNDYSRPLTDDDLKRLAGIFSGGICDYSRPGVGQKAKQNTWEHYEAKDTTENN